MRVIVIGAGVGGLTAAALLARAVERHGGRLPYRHRALRRLGVRGDQPTAYPRETNL